jgi:preprotein translocase subunit SecE
VARDRQRAKQRKARRAARNPGPAPSEPHRENVPGPLEHASGGVDEFEAALVAGVDGEPVDDDRTGAADADEREPEAEAEPRAADAAAIDEREPEAEAEPRAADEAVVDEREPEPPNDEPAPEDEPAALEDEQEVLEDEQEVLEDEDEFDYDEDEDDRDSAAARTPAAATRAEAPTTRGPGRFLAFLRASWAELQRVQWPDRRQVAQATAVVLGFVVVAGAFLGVADRIAQEVVDLII